jgi:orotate phosphoribosyltransferase
MGTEARLTSSAGLETDPLLERFWDKGLVLLGDRVREEYALHTPIFIDLRHKLYDDLDVLSSLGQALHRKLVSILEADADASTLSQQVIGIPDTATPLALSTAIASRTTARPVSYGQMRKKPAAYPGGRSGVSSYMGTKDDTREITLIDDVMASGRTKLWAIGELNKEGLEVARVLVVVDREQGGETVVNGRAYPLHSLYTISQVIHYYAATGKVDPETTEKALDHVRSRRFR